MNDHGSGPNSTTKEVEVRVASSQAFEWSSDHREDEAEEHNQLLQEFREKADLERGLKQPVSTRDQSHRPKSTELAADG